MILYTAVNNEKKMFHLNLLLCFYPSNNPNPSKTGSSTLPITRFYNITKTLVLIWIFYAIQKITVRNASHTTLCNFY